MEITARLTHDFIELKVDEIEVTIFKDSKQELDRTINNLKSVCEDLEKILV